MLLVDTHVHVIAPEDDLDHPRAEIAARTEWVISNAIDTEGLLSRMEKVDVEKAVLVQAISGHAFDNSYTADSALRFPEKFTSVGALDHTAPDAVATLQH